MKRSILMMMLAAMLGMAFVIPAQAAISWTCTFDFTASDGGWQKQEASSSSIGSYVGGATGWQSQFANIAPTGNASRLYLEREIDPTYITSISVTHQRPSSTNGLRNIWTELSGVTTQHYDEVNNVNYPAGTILTEAIEATADTLIVRMNASSGNVDIRYTAIIVAGTGDNPFTEGSGIDCDEIEGYTRPLAAEDVHLDIQSYSSGILQAQNSVIAISKSAGAHVHAGISGVITEVRRMNMNDCAYYLQSAFNTTPIQLVCWVFVEGGAYLIPGAALNLQVDVVKIEGEGGSRLQYLVANASKYVSQGQSIESGCWLGETFGYEGLEPDVSVGSDGLGASLGAANIAKGMVIVAREDGGTLIASVDDFAYEPTDTAPCNAPEGYENCLGDANLAQLSQWVTLNVNQSNPGVDILPNGYIKTEMNLSQTREPGLKVSLRSVGGTGSVRLTLGQTVSNFTIGSSPTPQTISIPSDDHSPDTSFYTIQVSNLGNTTINVRFICVQMAYDSEGSPTEAPPDGPEDTPNDNNSRCRLVDYSFDNPSGIWSLSSGESAVGEARLPHEATAGQSVSIPAGTYSISVVAAIWHYSTYTPNETSSDTVTIQYDYPAGSGYTTVEARTFGDFATNNNLLVFSDTLTLGSDTSGTFNLRPVLSDVPTGVRGVIVRSICVGSDSGGGGSGGSGGSSGSDWEGPFEASCSQISQPTGSTDVGSWTRWLWARFNQFHQCDLMVALNGIYNSMQRLLLLFGWSIRWGHEFANRGVLWFSRDFTLWLGGQIANMGGATLSVGDTVYGNVSASLPDWIWDPVSFGMQAGNATRDAIEEGKSITDVLLDTLQPIRDVIEAISNLVNLAFNFLFDVVPRLVRIGYNVVVGIFNNIGAFFDLILQLFQSYNDAEPQPIAGVMQCAVNPKENPVCIMLWVLEHTVFSGRGYLLIPFVVVYWTVLLVIWTVQRVSVKLRGSMQSV